MFLCRRASKNPACPEKRAKMTGIGNRESEEDSPPGTDSTGHFSFLRFSSLVVVLQFELTS